jgi:hypothetical protein
MTPELSRECPATGCSALIPADRFACRTHWYRLDSEHRIAVGSAWRRFLRDSTPANLTRLKRVQAKAIDYLNSPAGRS